MAEFSTSFEDLLVKQFGSGRHQASRERFEAGGLRVCFWNLNGVLSGLKKGSLRSFLISESPDVLVLLELKTRLSKLVKPSWLSLLSEFGFHYSYYNTCEDPSRGYSGVCLLSRVRPSVVVRGVGDSTSDHEGRVLTAVFPSFVLVSSYVPNSGLHGESDAKRRAFDEHMRRHLCSCQQGLNDGDVRPVIWIGDLNVIGRDSDYVPPLANTPLVGRLSKEFVPSCKPWERESLALTLSAAGLVDAAEVFESKDNPLPVTYYWVAKDRVEGRGLRLDHVMVSPCLLSSESRPVERVLKGEPCLSELEYHTEQYGSDHIPVSFLLKGSGCRVPQHPWALVRAADVKGFCDPSLSFPLHACRLPLPSLYEIPLARFPLRYQVTVWDPFSKPDSLVVGHIRAMGFNIHSWTGAWRSLPPGSVPSYDVVLARPPMDQLAAFLKVARVFTKPWGVLVPLAALHRNLWNGFQDDFQVHLVECARKSPGGVGLPLRCAWVCRGLFPTASAFRTNARVFYHSVDCLSPLGVVSAECSQSQVRDAGLVPSSVPDMLLDLVGVGSYPFHPVPAEGKRPRMSGGPDPDDESPKARIQRIHGDYVSGFKPDLVSYPLYGVIDCESSERRGQDSPRPARIGMTLRESASSADPVCSAKDPRLFHRCVSLADYFLCGADLGGSHPLPSLEIDGDVGHGDPGPGDFRVPPVVDKLGAASEGINIRYIMARAGSSRVPTLQVSIRGYRVRALLDSGAALELASLQWLRRVFTVSELQGLLDTVTPRPLFELADGTLSKPVGQLRLPLRIGGYRSDVLVWVLPEAPFDLILGSRWLDSVGAVMNYPARRIFWGHGAYHWSFQLAKNRSSCPVVAIRAPKVPLYSSDTFEVPALCEARFRVFSKSSERNACGRGGDASTDPIALYPVEPEGSSLVTARGLLPFETQKGWMGVLQVANLKSYPIQVRRGALVAYGYHVTDDDFWVFRSSPGAVDGVSVGSSSSKADFTAGFADVHDAPAVVEHEGEKEDSPLDAYGVPSDLKLDGPDSVPLTSDQKRRFREFVAEFNDVFARRYHVPPTTNQYHMPIDTGDSDPVSQPPRRANPQHRVLIREHISKLLQGGVIEPSASPWSADLLLIPKKDGSFRMAIDYRGLNKVTKPDVYPLTRIDDALSALEGSNWFSALDMASGFYGIPLKPADKEKTAFNTPDGQFQFTRMPFGLRNAPAAYSRAMDIMLGGLKWQTCLVYMDDILIFTKGSFDDHLRDLRDVFDRIRAFGLGLKAKKCSFFQRRVSYLGYVIDAQGIRTDPKKVAAVTKIAPPRSRRELRAFLGLAGYYRRFIRDFSRLASPLTTLLRGTAPFPRQLSSVQLAAFSALKLALSRDPVLYHPSFAHPFEIHTDASKHGLGAVLCQKVDGRERVIQYASRCLSEAEKKYTVPEWETLAAVWAMKTFRSFVFGVHFTLVCDSRLVKHILERPADCVRTARWALYSRGFSFTYHHRPGSKNGNAHGLSHLPHKARLRSGRAAAKSQPLHCTHTDCTSSLCISIPGCVRVEPVPTLVAQADGRLGLQHDQARGYDSEATSRQLLALLDVDDETFRAYFLEAQKRDAFCQRVVSALECRVLAESQQPPGIRRLARDMLIDDYGLLKRRRASCAGDSGDEGALQVVVPRELVSVVLMYYHGLPVSGHLGRDRTVELLSRRFWWPRHGRDVRRWIQSCLPCRRRKTPRPFRHALQQSMPASRPFERVAIDLVGPFRTTSNGNQYVLTMICCFLRWPIVVAIPNRKHEVIAQALFDNLIAVHGMPDCILSDRDPAIVGKAMTWLCDRWGLRKVHTTGYQPQANGHIERFHRYLNAALTFQVNSSKDDWDAALQVVAFAFRVSVHATTGLSPFRSLYGRDPVLPLDLLFGAAPPNYSDPRAYVSKMAGALQRAYARIRKLQAISCARNVDRVNARRSPLVLHPGESVLLFEPAAGESADRVHDRSAGEVRPQAPKRTRKLTFKWSGPHSVLRRMTSVTYKIAHRLRGDEVHHLNRLVVYTPWAKRDGLPVPSVSGREFKTAVQPPPFSGSLAAHEGLPVGTLVTMPGEGSALPFFVGSIFSVTVSGQYVVQWWGNPSDVLLGVYRPAWLDVKGTVYYRSSPQHPDHRAWTNLLTGPAVLTAANLVCASFKLTARERLPMSALRVLSSDPSVDWALPADDHPG